MESYQKASYYASTSMNTEHLLNQIKENYANVRKKLENAQSLGLIRQQKRENSKVFRFTNS